MKAFVLALVAAAFLSAGAPALADAGRKPVAEQEASVPFLHIGRPRSFRALDRDTLYIEARNREWYRVTTMGPCLNLPWAIVIGVDTHGSATFDRFSSLVVDGERCNIQSVVRSGEPPRRRPRRS